VPDACRALAAWFDDGSTAEAIESELLARVTVVVGREARAMAGAPALVALVRDRVPTAVASNSPRALLDRALARGGFTGTLGVSVAADEVARPKPAPDLYLAACARLGAAPERCLALEDSAPGVRSALAAGLRTIAVPTVRGSELGAVVSVAALDDPGLVAWVQSWPTPEPRPFRTRF
jgi:HAD superfamily hydrolase (TIGR01509 family)